MARRTKLIGEPFLPFIYNVSQPVGPGKLNLPDDVELVQFFLAAFAAKPAPTGFHRVLFPAPAITRSWDMVTGFWTYEVQFHLEKKRRSIIDGVVSPAREGTDGTYGGGRMWTIVALNFSLKSSAPNIFESLPDHPSLSKSLRDSIRPTATPVAMARR